MRFVWRIFSKNCWYKKILEFTIGGTLRKTGGFTSRETGAILKRYALLNTNNSGLVKDIQSEYHVAWCSAILAIYEACLSKQMDAERALRATEDVIFSNMKPEYISNQIRRALDRSDDPFLTIVNSSRDQEKNFFGSAFRFSRPVDAEDSYHLRVHDCMYDTFFRAHGVPQLMKIACKWDLISWSMGIVPEKHRILFQRPVTLGLDGKDCEFNFDRIPSD